MISSKVIRYFSFRLLNTNFAQFNIPQRRTKCAQIINSKETNAKRDECDNEGTSDGIKPINSSTLIQRLNDDFSSQIEFLDEASLTKTDKQSRELAEFVPKENYEGTFNLAAYLNKSETLQHLHKLGVDFSKIEKRKGLGQFVLQLNFETDIRCHLTFLHDIGVPAHEFGEILTKNPLIFKESLDDLQTRINYLGAKKFKINQIQRICTINPYWLMFSTKRIDKRLGYFQQNFKLTGDDTRHLATKQPRLITYKMDHIRENTFCIREEMGFNSDEIQCLLLSKPKLWMMKRGEIIERFDYIHNVMKLSHQQILESPEILTSRRYRVKQRNEFLEFLDKAQYDIKAPQFISPKKLVEGTEQEFAENICGSSMEEYEKFLRRL